MKHSDVKIFLSVNIAIVLDRLGLVANYFGCEYQRITFYKEMDKELFFLL